MSLRSNLETLNFDNSFARLDERFYTKLQPTALHAPYLVSFSEDVAELIGLDANEKNRQAFVDYFSGQRLLPGSEPLAMVYSGHQFGAYNPQLGDGRGLLLGEVRTATGEKWDLHLKGAGITPYSRQGDGRAVLRSCIREYLCSEAMHFLGIPTSRALCVIGSKHPVRRETVEPGATLLRVAPSHIRFGSFEYFFYTQQYDLLNQLLDYTITHNFSEYKNNSDKVSLFLQDVVKRTARLIAKWQAAGWAHGVMNTDNFSVLGITFDYGPFGFLDDYQSGYICNHSDYHGRYAFDQQPNIGLWNLNAFAHTLSPFLDQADIRSALKQYEPELVEEFSQLIRAKLGLQLAHPDDQALVFDLFELMESNAVDYTIFFRRLCAFKQNELNEAIRDLFLNREAFDQWAQRYTQRLAHEQSQDAERSERMRRVNPKYILRNYLAQQAIEKAHQGDFSEVESLHRCLRRPFDEAPEFEHYAAFPPDWGKKLEISCSS
ncbi:MAG TPA: YdiU family protein [Pseudomonadales bacterium]|nr:YdiU family protein [Pseudomonadales bacterium]